MFTRKKYDAVMANLKSKATNPPEKIELEKNDMLALLIAGTVTMLPALLILVALMFGISMFFIR